MHFVIKKTLQVPGCRLQGKPGTWNLELGTWNLEPGTWNWELGTGNLELGTKEL